MERKIGLDLDGVILNQTPLKIKLAAERGWYLSPEQTPSDVIRDFLPPQVMREVERERYANPEVVFSTPLMEGARKNLLRMRARGLPFFLITRRDFPELVVELLRRHELWPVCFDESNTFFVQRSEDKDEVAKKLGLTHYADDRASILDQMPSVENRILFDQWGVFSGKTSYRRFSSWGALADYLLEESEESFFEFLSRLEMGPYPGRFINIDSLSGTGKSTQVKKLVEYLRGLGIEVLQTKEPTDGKIGQMIRESLERGSPSELEPLQFQLLFAADRAGHLTRQVLPALQAGKWAVTDRYALASLSYGYAMGVPSWQLLAMNLSFPWPNLNLVLSLPVEESLHRIAGRKEKPRSLHEVEERMERISAAYRWMACHLPSVFFIDGSGSEEEVFARIRKIVDGRLLPSAET